MTDEAHAEAEREQLRRSIGRIARKARHGLRLTQEAAADRADICPEFYARIERGDALPSVSTLFRIANALDASVDRLLGLGDSAQGPAYGPQAPDKLPTEMAYIVSQARRRPLYLRLVTLLLKAFE